MRSNDNINDNNSVMSSSVKKVIINLQSPQKQRKTRSPSPSNKKEVNYNVSIQQLRETIGNENVYKSIQMQHQRKIKEAKKAKNKGNLIQVQAQLDGEGQTRLTLQELNICKTLFRTLDKHCKNFTEAADLEELADNRLKNIVRVAYFRRAKNSFIDFVFALWDSQSLPYLIDYYNHQF